MPLKSIVLFAAHWQLSLSARPSKLVLDAEETQDILRSEETQENAPEGWAEVLVPLAPHAHDTLGFPGLSHSQVGQDKLVASILNCKREGFYLDMAANNAVTLSNTLMLERDFGWNGICIEANPQYMLGLSKRNCQTVLAAVGSSSNQDVTFAFRDIYGGIVDKDFDNTPDDVKGPTVNMKTKAFSEILVELEAPTVIDYLSLDVEGAESFVMKGFPWDSHTIRVITVERPQDDLVETFKSKGYHFPRMNSQFDDQTWVNSETWAEISSMHWDTWQEPSIEQFHQKCPLDVAAPA